MTELATVETLQLFDALPAHIEDALRASIVRFGVLVPVVKDQHGRIIDGHHRSRIAAELGVELGTQTIEVSGEDEAREIARTLNSDRRQLTEEQRREVVRVLREQGHSIRGIAGALKVSHGTVGNDVAQLSSVGQLEQPERVRGLDGRSRPATMPPRPEPPSQPDAACEACGGPMDVGQFDAGFMRCDDCDGDEAHTAAGFPHGRNGQCVGCNPELESAKAKPEPSAEPVVLPERIEPPDPEVRERIAREREERQSNEVFSKTIVDAVWHLANFGAMDEAIERALAKWQPSQDYLPIKTTAARMRLAADYLYALAERWPL